jgi:NAD(P)-binding Rossmann-like domain
MANPILKRAVVIGAGIGGLAAAKAVTPHFEKVIVFDRRCAASGHQILKRSSIHTPAHAPCRGGRRDRRDSIRGAGAPQGVEYAPRTPACEPGSCR